MANNSDSGCAGCISIPFCGAMIIALVFLFGVVVPRQKEIDTDVLMANAAVVGVPMAHVKSTKAPQVGISEAWHGIDERYNRTRWGK